MERPAKKKILLIDDDTSLLVTLSDFLRFEKYDVASAESGEQGLERLKETPPDLIILDMSMPGMGGVGFLKAISSPDGTPSYPVLVLTARANMAEFFASVKVDGFIAKPCEPSDLLMEVGRVLFLRSGSGETLDPAVASEQAFERARILIGEDRTDVNELLVRAFADEGCIVESAARGPEVLEKAVVGRPDVVVMNLACRNMSGDTVAGVLADMDSTRDTPIILYDDGETETPDDQVLASAATVMSFVRSSDPPGLVAAARGVLAGRAGY